VWSNCDDAWLQASSRGRRFSDRATSRPWAIGAWAVVDGPAPDLRTCLRDSGRKRVPSDSPVFHAGAAHGHMFDPAAPEWVD